MGVNLRDLVSKTPIQFEGIKDRIVGIDGYNALYQFLAIIRQPDGTPLQDSKGRVTSHLSGTFYRTANLLEAGIRPVYVFDGKPPELKSAEIAKRAEVKERAREEYRLAVERGDIEGARRHAQATSRLTKPMVEQAKQLLSAMGVPTVQAPSEGEAQAAYMTRKGDAWATASQDYDSLLFGASRLVRNFAITGRRKLPGKPVYINIEPEMLKLEDVLTELALTREQLIDVGILLGTDFNPEGFEGIGPKKALKIIKDAGSFRAAVEKGMVKPEAGVDYDAIREIFLNPSVTSDYKLGWSQVDAAGVRRILVDSFEFSLERVDAALDRMSAMTKEQKRQPNLEKWF